MLVGVDSQQNLTAWTWPGREQAWQRPAQGFYNTLTSRPGSQQILLLKRDAQGGCELELLDGATGTVERVLTPPLTLLGSPTFSPDGKTVAVAGKMAERDTKVSIALVDIGSGKERGRLVGGFDSVMDIAFSPSGKRIFASYWDGNFLVWDAETQTEMLSLRGEGLNLANFVVTSPGILFGGEFQGGRLHALDGRPATEVMR